jgi:hypothetical protein
VAFAAGIETALPSLAEVVDDLAAFLIPHGSDTSIFDRDRA